MKEPELSEGVGRRSSLSPLIAYRHYRNLRDILVRAQLPTRKYQRPRHKVRTALSVHWWGLGTRLDQHPQIMSMKWGENSTVSWRTSTLWSPGRIKASSTLENLSTLLKTDGLNTEVTSQAQPGRYGVLETFKKKRKEWSTFFKLSTDLSPVFS